MIDDFFFSNPVWCQLRKADVVPALKDFKSSAEYARFDHRWCLPADRGTVSKYKHSIKAHVYMGISHWGATKLMIMSVTGTHQHQEKFPNSKTGGHHARMKHVIELDGDYIGN